jgi:hypothetical protein
LDAFTRERNLAADTEKDGQDTQLAKTDRVSEKASGTKRYVSKEAMNQYDCNEQAGARLRFY